jgi:hypothetical protein
MPQPPLSCAPWNGSTFLTLALPRSPPNPRHPQIRLLSSMITGARKARGGELRSGPTRSAPRLPLITICDGVGGTDRRRHPLAVRIPPWTSRGVCKTKSMFEFKLGFELRTWPVGRARGREGARARGCEGARARGREGARARGREGASRGARGIHVRIHSSSTRRGAKDAVPK